jgi:hypothetical protein
MTDRQAQSSRNPSRTAVKDATQESAPALTSAATPPSAPAEARRSPDAPNRTAFAPASASLSDTGTATLRALAQVMLR